jgi:hypothetical protein
VLVMRRAVILIVVVFLLAAALGLALGQFLAVSQRIAHVSDLQGSVLAKAPRATDYVPLSPAANVLAGTVLKTGPQASATLNWIDGTRLKIGPNSIMTVLKCQINRSNGAETSVFRLDAGDILVRVRRLLSGESKFEIQTPTATAGVRGTIFGVHVASDGRTEVEVFEGRVDLKTAQQELQVPSGSRAVATKGSAALLARSGLSATHWRPDWVTFGPYLVVNQPEEGATVATGSVEVSGQVEKGAQVTVNGQPVAVNALNRFIATVQVPTGIKRFAVTVVARDERGYETRVSREVRVTETAPGPDRS